MKLSLLVTYRQREKHLKTQLAWWKSQQEVTNYEILIIEADEYPSAWIAAEIADTNIKYAYLPCRGAFHKTKALNLGLSLASGEFVAPFDVDLIPLTHTLSQHLKIAQLSPLLLVTGYRVMLDNETLDVSNAITRTTIAPEDQPTALWKQLVHQERFGVVPFFKRDRLLEIGGWDQTFIGWGGRGSRYHRKISDGRTIFISMPRTCVFTLTPSTQPTLDGNSFCTAK